MAKQILKLIKINYKPVLFVFVTLMLMVAVSIRTSSSIVNHQMQIIGEETLNTARSNVTASLGESQATFANIGVTVESMLRSGRTNDELLTFLEEMNQHFRSDQTSMPDFLKIYAFLNSEFLDGSGWVPPDDYIPQERPWYIGAAASQQVFFSEPYLDADTGDICVSFSLLVKDPDGNLAGILALDLSISRIISYMEQLELGNGSYGMVINNRQEFVGHKYHELIGTPVQEAGGDYGNLAGSMDAYETISARRMRDVDGTNVIAFFNPIFNGWYLGLVIPTSSYYAPVYKLTAALGLIGLLLAAILSGLLLRTRYERMISIEESRSKSNFLSRMSHEMRTPMNAIIGMAGMAKRTDDSEQIRYCINQIDIASNHLLGIINDVLDISKIESGKFTVAKNDFILETMISRVASVISHALDEKAQNFSITIDPDLPYSLVTDEQRVAQVITNLLSNAVKFTPENGKIELIVDKAASNADSCLVRFQVRDSGIGIEPDQLEMLFQPFVQADNTISRQYGGTGLGLAISKSIVERLGGSIRAESTPGHGSVFTFTIRAGYGVQTRKQLSPATPWQLIRILVVDDQPEILRFMEDFSLISGITCRKASDAQEALRLLSMDTDFDFVFIDYDMPDISGTELCHQIQKAAPKARCVLMLSRLERPAAPAGGTDTEVSAYIEKPLFASAIADCIANYYIGPGESSDEPQRKESPFADIFTGRTVLVAEDVDINVEILTALLEVTGITIEWVKNGRLAVEAFTANPDCYDLILMDIHMPELDGYDATRQIRALAVTRATSVPIVAMTANVFQEDIDHCLQAGMNDHIGKPLDFNELIATLKRYM